MNVTQHTEQVDLLVIGWGKAGKTLAAHAAARGLNVAIVERSPDRVGGTCINVACVPTKILVHEANSRRVSDAPQEFFSRAVKRRDTLTSRMREKNFQMLAERDTVLTVIGHASFIGPREVLVTGGAESLRFTAESIVLNTGTEPAEANIPGATVGGRIHDSETLQQVAHFPQHLVVVGGGYVGLEFASMFANFGSKVTVLDRGERPLKHEDADVAEVAASAMRESGVTFMSRAQVVRMSEDDASAKVEFERESGLESVNADAVLIALGRSPVTKTLRLERAGIDTDERGFIRTDEFLRTTVPNVFAVGDVNGGPQFTYVSLDDSRIVADQLFGSGSRSTKDRVAIPYTMFVTPPLARVGMTEHEARAAGFDVRVAARALAEIVSAPRAAIEGDVRGIVKVVVDGATDEILGAALMHVHAQEVINLVALAIRHGITASDLKDSMYTHPSATEALNEVLGTLS